MVPGKTLLRLAAALSLAASLALPDETPAAPKSGTKPSVSAPSPAKGTVNVSATASPGGLNRLEIHVDGKFLVSCPGTPCDYPWNSLATPDGTHALVAKRYGNNGSVTSSDPVSVTVANYAPAVALTAPAAAAGLVPISVSATDANGVTTTQLYIDAVLVRTATGGSLTYQWDTTMYSNGTHTVQAAATDSIGNTGTSSSVNVSVNNGGSVPSGPGLGDPSIYPEPYPAPALPPAGGRYTDPTFGTTITRVTDPSTAPGGAAVNSAPTDSMFNADGSMFYLYLQGVGARLYSLDRATGGIAPLGPFPSLIAWDGARWDPGNPAVLYGITMNTVQRQLYAVTLPAGTTQLLHDFSNEVPTGGYPSSRVQVSPDSRYFAITASTYGGQDDFDYVVVWDRQTNTSTVLNVKVTFNMTLHAMEMDNSGQWLRLGTWDSSIGSMFWKWQADPRATATSGPVILSPPDYFGGHKVFGAGVVFNPGVYSDQWLTRSLATPHTFTTLVTAPRKNGLADWFQDVHGSRVLADGSFIASYYVGGLSLTWVQHSAAVYKSVNYRQNSLTSGAVPDTLRYKGTTVPQVAGIPAGAGQWSYDPATDTVYVWLPDGSSAITNAAQIFVLDWRPLTDEVVQFLPDGGGGWTWRRLAHHRSHYTGWGTDPRANADPTGSFVLFQSNWGATLRNTDGSPRTDVFLIRVP